MTKVPTNQRELIVDENRLAEVMKKISNQPIIGLDLEGNGRHRYPEQICLIQISIPGFIYIVDPLGIANISPLGSILADESVEKILHSSDYDLRCLDRDWGFRIQNLFDAAIGAAFLGLSKTGLAAVLQEVLGVEIAKSKRLQKSDWTIRPLTAEALEYAASDVAHLHELREKIRQQLEELGRLTWFVEECKRQSVIRYVTRDPETAFLSLKGSYALDERGLAVLKQLVELRERHAVLRGRPHFQVLSTSTLITLSEKPHADLKKVSGLGAFAREPLVTELRATLDQGLRATPYQRPIVPRKPRMRTAQKRRLESLKQWRKDQAQELKIDSSLIWPMPSLERLAWDPNEVQQEMEGASTRLWQVAEFGASLVKAAKDL